MSKGPRYLLDVDTRLSPSDQDRTLVWRITK